MKPMSAMQFWAGATDGLLKVNILMNIQIISNAVCKNTGTSAVKADLPQNTAKYIILNSLYNLMKARALVRDVHMHSCSYSGTLGLRVCNPTSLGSSLGSAQGPTAGPSCEN
jgi:hypothetical protein